MRFNLLDKIEHLADDRLVGVKHVSLAEEYLADHFPSFPVLPGVLMLEAAVQAAGWLLHHRSDFACSMAILREARQIKYGQFVSPGNFLRIEVQMVKAGDGVASFKAGGSVGGETALAGRIEMAYFNLAERQPELAELDRRLIEHHRRRWALLRRTTEYATTDSEADYVA